MKEELFNNETKRKAGQQGKEESQHPVYQRQPRQLGLYDAENEHDACGVGMLVNIHGGKSHELVESALKVLENMRHRGAEGADNKTGDGAGILLQIPHEFILLSGYSCPREREIRYRSSLSAERRERPRCYLKYYHRRD